MEKVNIQLINESQAKEIQCDFNPVYNHSDFIELNEYKVDTVEYALFSDHKPRALLILGLKHSLRKSGFSAPFGSFSFVDADIRIEVIYKIVEELTNWSKINNYKIEIVIPPLCYGNTLISCLINVFYNFKWNIKKIDLNYEYYLTNFNKNQYLQNSNYSVRKNLKSAIKSNLRFEYFENTQDKKRVYEIIKTNRQQMNKPLRMTWDEIQKTGEIIQSWYFGILKLDCLVASAIVFKVTKDIVQVIYWGDDRTNNADRPMNFLAFELFNYFKNLDFKIVDIGPSTENSVPNFGLCDFKSSIGCTTSLKYTVEY